MLEPTQNHKDKLISRLVSSEDVQFYWYIATADFDIGDEKPHSELLKYIIDLFVTVRGFAFASSWIEKHKQFGKSQHKDRKVYVRKSTLTKDIRNYIFTTTGITIIICSYHSFLLYYIYIYNYIHVYMFLVKSNIKCSMIVI